MFFNTRTNQLTTGIFSNCSSMAFDIYRRGEVGQAQEKHDLGNLDPNVVPLIHIVAQGLLQILAGVFQDIKLKIYKGHGPDDQ